LSAALLVVERGLSVRDTEALVKRLHADGEADRPARSSSPPVRKDTDTLALEADLSNTLGLRVEVSDKGGYGEVRVHYAALEQLDEICRRLSRR
jgi:ParB family chromosome partitioning protein